MEIGGLASGTLKVQNITLDGTDLSTTLTGKQAEITSSTTLDVGTIQNTLLTNVTLGNTWKYQNSGGYFVRNATNNDIIEYINPSDGTHNWYGAGDTSRAMTWNPALERLFVSGYVLADKYLHRIAGTVVRGYAFFRFQGTSGTINMNSTGANVPWTNVHVDGQTFLPVGSTEIKIINTGYYEVGFNILCTSIYQRANPTIRIRINGNDTGYLSWSYIRASTNHNECSWSLSPVLMPLNADDLLTIQGRFTTNCVAGSCYLYNNTTSTNTAYPTLMIKRVA
jgi:hypothetical protein